MGQALMAPLVQHSAEKMGTPLLRILFRNKNKKMQYIRRIHRILGVFKFSDVSFHLLRGGEALPLSRFSWPILIRRDCPHLLTARVNGR